MVAVADKEMARQYLRDLRVSQELTGSFYAMYGGGTMIASPEKVIETLKRANVRFVVMGTHGVGFWRTQARATEDVDVLVSKRDLKKAVRALHEEFPTLDIVDGVVGTRFIDPISKIVAIVVIKPEQEVFRLALRYTKFVEESHRVPDLEMALVSKFAAMVSPRRREEKKLIDGADFVRIARINMPDIDRKKLSRLAEKVCVGGGKEVLRHIKDIEEGRKITF